MRTFALTAFATLAFGLFCSATPTPSNLPVTNPPLVDITVRDTPVSVPAQGAPSLQSVITVATNSIQPLADKVGESVPSTHPPYVCR